MLITSKRHPNSQVKISEIIRPEDVCLPEGLFLRVKAYCRACGNSYNYDGDIDTFDEDMSYCGRSYRCTP